MKRRGTMNCNFAWTLTCVDIFVYIYCWYLSSGPLWDWRTCLDTRISWRNLREHKGGPWINWRN